MPYSRVHVYVLVLHVCCMCALEYTVYRYRYTRVLEYRYCNNIAIALPPRPRQQYELCAVQGDESCDARAARAAGAIEA